MNHSPENAKPENIMRTPRSADIEITSRCNLRCRYCYYFDNPLVDYRDLPAQDWLAFFAELGRCAVMNVTLQGGEPFIRRDLPEIITGIVQNRMRFSLLSNGTLITDTMAAFIADTGRCDMIQVSLDGSCPEVHDSCRGKGAFASAVKGIRLLQKHLLPVSVRVTVHPGNVHDLENTACFLLEELAVPGFSTNSAAYLGSCLRNRNAVMLTPEQRQTAMDTLVRLSEKYAGKIAASAGPLAEARQWAMMEKARRENAPLFPKGGCLSGCGCSMSKIAIRSDGHIIPCTLLANMILGRINEDDLRDIWQNSPVLNRLRSRYQIPLTSFAFCADCPYIPYCTGNCPAAYYHLAGEVNHPAPDSCLRKFQEDRGELFLCKKYLDI